MKTFVSISISCMIVLFITACSGGGGSKSSSNNQTNTTTGNQTTNPNTNGSISGNQTNPDNTNKTDTCTGGGIVKHGYQLPPCPDPIENDKTLLGIDTNNNGVRDDVEIWIYHTYDTHKNCTTVETGEVFYNGTVIGTAVKTVCSDEEMPYHQIVREIAMQYAKAYQIVIQEPEKARETYPILDAAQYCGFYFERWAKYYNDPILTNDYYLYDKIENIQFNTIQRARAYSKYNFHLGGGVYGSPLDSYKKFCDFDVDTLLGK